jgi:hypothetical protein
MHACACTHTHTHMGMIQDKCVLEKNVKQCLCKEDLVLTRRVWYETAMPGSPQRCHPLCSVHCCIMEDSCMMVNWHG